MRDKISIVAIQYERNSIITGPTVVNLSNYQGSLIEIPAKLIILLRAWLDGERQQLISLPIQTASRGRRADAMPPGIQQQFEAVIKLSELLLSGLKKNRPLQGPLKADLLDDADPIGTLSCCVDEVMQEVFVSFRN